MRWAHEIRRTVPFLGGGKGAFLVPRSFSFPSSCCCCSYVCIAAFPTWVILCSASCPCCTEQLALLLCAGRSWEEEKDRGGSRNEESEGTVATTEAGEAPAREGSAMEEEEARREADGNKEGEVPIAAEQLKGKKREKREKKKGKGKEHRDYQWPPAKGCSPDVLPYLSDPSEVRVRVPASIRLPVS